MTGISAEKNNVAKIAAKKALYSKLVKLFHRYCDKQDKGYFSAKCIQFISGEGYDFSEENDELLDDLFSYCVNICDGEAAFTPQDLREAWQEIIKIIGKMETVVKETEDSHR